MKSNCHTIAFALTIAMFALGCQSVSEPVATDASWIGDRHPTIRHDVSRGGVLTAATDHGVDGTVTVQLTDHVEPSLPTPITGLTPLREGELGSVNPALIGGTQLGSAQVTATEYALRLKDENARMKRAGQKLLADNRRLQTELGTRDDLLNRVQAAMTEAQEKLAAANHLNQRLKDKVTMLENQQQQRELATQRMLTTVRAELDDALMREISAGQE